MLATYRFVVNGDYWRTERKRYERQRPFALRRNIMPVLALLSLAFGFFMLWLQDNESASNLAPKVLGIAFLITFLLETLRVVTNLRIQKRLSKATSETLCTLSEEGVSIQQEIAQTKLAWSYYLRAVRYADGLLLMRGMTRLWLPDSALDGATPKEATDLVQSKTKLRHVA